MDRAGVYDRLDSLFHYFYTHLDTFTVVFYYFAANMKKEE